MPITDKEGWKRCQANNQDPYGGCVVKVAEEVMRLLDERPGDFDPHKLISEADRNVKAGGITGFMAGGAAAIIAGCHSRGDEFRRKWNLDTQIGDEGEKANDRGTILNPALLSFEAEE